METAVTAAGEIGEKLAHFRSGVAIAVDVSAIEKELASLWRHAAGDGAARDDSVSRACLWNLIVWTETEADFARARQLVDAIAPACPARALVLRRAAGEGAELTASIEGNCRIGADGARLLCSEEITLTARGRGEDHLPGLVRALQVPDVPAALIWAGALPADSTHVRRLLAGASRLVVDTGDLGSEGRLEGLAELARLATAVELADLGWIRLASFRMLLAGVFDRPVGPEPLRRLARVRLECSRHGAGTAQLLLGWLASRLGWPRFVAQGAGRWSAGATAVEIDVRDVDAGRDGIFQLLLETDRGEQFSLTDSGPELLEIAAAGLPTRTVAAPDAARSDAELLVAALGTRGSDPLFGLALARAAELS